MKILKACLIICISNFLFIFIADNGFAQVKKPGTTDYNNSFATAELRNLGSSMLANLNKSNDLVDYFKVDITSDGTVDIFVDCRSAITSPLPPADLRIQVYNNSFSNVLSDFVNSGQSAPFSNIDVSAGAVYLKFTLQTYETGDRGYVFRVYNYQPTQSYYQVTFEAQTVNKSDGRMALYNCAHVYYEFNDYDQMIQVYDGGSFSPMPIDVDPNSEYSYSEVSSSSSETNRYIASGGNTEGTITSSKTITVNYYHQLKMIYRAVTVNGGTVMTSSNKPTVIRKISGSDNNVYPYDGTDITAWSDAGSYSYSETSSGSDNTQRWSTVDSDKSGSVNSGASVEVGPIIVDYYQQYKPVITLSGIDSSNTVDIVTRTLYGEPAVQTGICDSIWSDWCDVGSALSFSESTTGTQSKSTTDTRSWTVNSAFNAAVNYVYSTNVQTQPEITPRQFYLSQNYPNPFNPTTTIKFQIPVLSLVTLNIYNIYGELVRNMVSKRMLVGHHSVIWDGTNNFGQQVSSGLYIYRIQANNFTAVKKMMFIK